MSLEASITHARASRDASQSDASVDDGRADAPVGVDQEITAKYVAGASIKDLMNRAGESEADADTILAFERASDKPRKSLVAKLSEQ